MKIKTQTLFILSLIVQTVFGQWNQQTTPQGQWYKGIHFVNTTTGWAVGNSGAIVNTTNGGQTWNTQTAGTAVNLKAVHGVDQNNAWIIGDWNNAGNTLLKTTNGGSSWQLTDPEPSLHRYYEDIQFVGSNDGWIVGASGKILHTANAGATWTNQSISPTGPTVLAVSFVSATTGWICCSDGRIWKTINGGTNWIVQSTPTAALATILYDVFFIDANNGWACGDGGVVLATSNGGTTWTQIATNVTGSNCSNGPLLSIHFTSATHGFGSGCFNKIVETTDGGVTWVLANASMGFGYKLFFINASLGWCAGSNGIASTATVTAPPTPTTTPNPTTTPTPTTTPNPTTTPTPTTATGLQVYADDNSLVIYPNPATNILTVNSGGQQLDHILIISSEGREVVSLAGPGAGDIDVSGMAAGFYFIRLTVKDRGVITKKLIIVH